MRSYVRIKEESEDVLHFVKEPGFYGYALLAAFTAIGYGAASYSQDSYFWQAVYVSFGVFIGLACMDDYEECVFNKKDKDVRLTKLTIWDRIISTVCCRSAYVDVFSTEDIIDVKVKEGSVTYFGKGYQVLLLINSGMEISITDSFSFGKNSKEHDQVADKIKTFLHLNHHGNDLTDSSTDEEEEEDGFEHITEQVIEEELKTDQ